MLHFRSTNKDESAARLLSPKTMSEVRDLELIREMAVDKWEYRESFFDSVERIYETN